MEALIYCLIVSHWGQISLMARFVSSVKPLSSLSTHGARRCENPHLLPHCPSSHCKESQIGSIFIQGWHSSVVPTLGKGDARDRIAFRVSLLKFHNRSTRYFVCLSQFHKLVDNANQCQQAQNNILIMPYKQREEERV